MARTIDDPTLCYLCGLPIGRTTPTMDHVPPRRLHPAETRKSLDVGLLTLKTHPDCHGPWGKDEEYFYNTLLPQGLQSPLGEQLAADFKKTLRHEGGNRLAWAVAKQFEEHPSGLVLPGDRLIQRYDGDRMRAVVWKIVRGLYFHESGQKTVLPERTPRVIRFYGPQDETPELAIAIMGEPSRGRVPTVFDYKFYVWEEKKAQFWDLLVWERHVVFVAFHEPYCDCSQCEEARAGAA